MKPLRNQIEDAVWSLELHDESEKNTNITRVKLLTKVTLTNPAWSEPGYRQRVNGSINTQRVMHIITILLADTVRIVFPKDDIIKQVYKRSNPMQAKHIFSAYGES
jgi:hypothetical protein